MSALEQVLHVTLAELVRIDSTSSLTNAPLVDYLEGRLAAMGFSLERHEYLDEAGVKKTNLLGLRGEGAPELALVGHTDCVPFDPAWADALRLTPKDGKLYGRGACDTKGFIACALVALEQVDHRRAVRVVFTADEEVGCLGAKRLVEAQRGGARFAIVGEPTSLRPIRANKGYCLAEVEVRGQEGHSAYPHLGQSAIFAAARLLSRLEEESRGALRAELDPAFDPPHTTVNVGVIAGGKARNVIPGSCRFAVEWRPIPSQPAERVAGLLEGLRRELCAEIPGLEVDIRLVRSEQGVDTSPQSPIVRFLEEATGQPAGTVAFGTEAPQLTALGAQAVVFGPGDIRVAHRTGEFVPEDELGRCEQILERALRTFCDGR